MATEARPLFDFYFRYKWNEVDFADWQNTMIGTMRDTIGSIFGPSLISGGAVAPSGSTRAVTVAAYETVNSAGYTSVRNSTVLAAISANASGNPRKDLIVARPLLTNQTMISRPTSPFDSVPFKIGQDTQVVVIAGTPAGSPTYPAKVAGDVVLAGLAVANGATSFSGGDIDTTVTEVLSGNTNFSNWVVGKDIHGTVAITGDSGATRAAIVAAGGNGHAAITATGSGSAAAIEATGTAGAFHAAISATAGADAQAVAITANGGIGSGLSVGANGGALTAAATVAQSGNGYGLTVETLGNSDAAIISAVNGTGIGLRVVGNNTAAPVWLIPSSQPSGPNDVGSLYMAAGGVLKVCTVAGTPGTWVSVGTQT